MELICFILSVAFQLFIAFLVLHRDFKNEKDIFGRIAMVLGILSIILPSIVYFADFYNISAFFNKKGTLLNSIEWFQFASMLASSISGACISGVILYLFNQQQINMHKTQEKETKRIENAPIFQYQISDKIIDNDGRYYSDMNIEDSNQRNISLLDGSNKNSRQYNIFFSIENIGLNHARNVCVSVSEGINHVNVNNSIDDDQSILKKGNKYWFDFVFNYSLKKYDIKTPIYFKVYYDDFLGNSYIQEIELEVFLSDEHLPECRGYHMDINSKKIFDEQVLGEDDVIC